MLNKVKSLKILNIILGILKKRIELKILKYNKKIMNKLKIKKEDFEQFILLKELNFKFNLDIKDIDINELDLEDMNLDNDIIEYFNKIKFKNLKVLNLIKNNISDINEFENCKLNQLEKLGLGSNKIQNIDILEMVNFKELKYLDLYKNNISDIKVLEKVKFEKLELLNLGENKITDINVLEKVNFKELKQLGLHKNNISDIKVLEKVKFEKLELLNLGGNKINKIQNNLIISKMKSILKI